MMYFIAGDDEHVHYDIIRKFWELDIHCVGKPL